MLNFESVGGSLSEVEDGATKIPQTAHKWAKKYKMCSVMAATVGLVHQQLYSNGVKL
jgi:hypothetical protein